MDNAAGTWELPGSHADGEPRAARDGPHVRRVHRPGEAGERGDGSRGRGPRGHAPEARRGARGAGGGARSPGRPRGDERGALHAGQDGRGRPGVRRCARRGPRRRRRRPRLALGRARRRARRLAPRAAAEEASRRSSSSSACGTIPPSRPIPRPSTRSPATPTGSRRGWCASRPGCSSPRPGWAACTGPPTRSPSCARSSPSRASTLSPSASPRRSWSACSSTRGASTRPSPRLQVHAPRFNPKFLQRIGRLHVRRAALRVADAVLAGFAGLALLALGQAFRRGKGAVALHALRSLGPTLIFFTGVVALFGGALARSYESGTAGPFFLLAAGGAPVVLVARAWSSVGSDSRAARVGRALLGGGAAVAAAFVLLEAMNPRYLDGFTASDATALRALGRVGEAPTAAARSSPLDRDGVRAARARRRRGVGRACTAECAPLEIHMAVTARCAAGCKGCYLDVRPDGVEPPLEVLERARARRGGRGGSLHGGLRRRSEADDARGSRRARRRCDRSRPHPGRHHERARAERVAPRRLAPLRPGQRELRWRGRDLRERPRVRRERRRRARDRAPQPRPAFASG